MLNVLCLMFTLQVLWREPNYTLNMTNQTLNR